MRDVTAELPAMDDGAGELPPLARHPPIGSTTAAHRIAYAL